MVRSTTTIVPKEAAAGEHITPLVAVGNSCLEVVGNSCLEVVVSSRLAVVVSSRLLRVVGNPLHRQHTDNLSRLRSTTSSTPLKAADLHMVQEAVAHIAEEGEVQIMGAVDEGINLLLV
jgi:hypothetical protein